MQEKGLPHKLSYRPFPSPDFGRKQPRDLRFQDSRRNSVIYMNFAMPWQMSSPEMPPGRERGTLGRTPGWLRLISDQRKRCENGDEHNEDNSCSRLNWMILRHFAYLSLEWYTINLGADHARSGRFPHADLAPTPDDHRP